MKPCAMIRSPARWAFFRNDDRLLLIAAGAVSGIVSGLAAVALHHALTLMALFFSRYRGHTWAFLLPASGAALSSLFLTHLMREEPDHGIPEVINSVSRFGGFLRFRSSFSRLVSSALTIGSGGSAGPEAPVVISGSAIGSNIASFFSLNERQRVTLVGCGAAGAISAIFNAPLAGMIFTMEIILGEWSIVNIVPIAIASVVGTEVSHFLRGDQAILSHGGFHIHPVDSVAAIGLAVFTSLASVTLIRMLRGMHHAASDARLPIFLKAAAGGAAVGLIGLYFPHILNEGYLAITTMIEGAFQAGVLVALIGVMLKIVATSLTLGWGGSGGIFAPCLVIGSFTGLFFVRVLFFLFPSVTWAEEGCYALLGMAGMVSGLLQAPLTGIFLVVEITGSYEVMLPLIVVSAFSTAMSRYFEPSSYYLKDLVERGDLLRPGTDSRVLSDLTIEELLETDCIRIKNNMLLRDLIPVIQRSRRNYFPVEDGKTGELAGMVHLDDIRPYLFNRLMYDTVIVEQIMNAHVKTADIGESLSTVLSIMDREGLFSMPVLREKRFAGMISKATILDRYRKELMVQTPDS